MPLKPNPPVHHAVTFIVVDFVFAVEHELVDFFVTETPVALLHLFAVMFRCGEMFHTLGETIALLPAQVIVFVLGQQPLRLFPSTFVEALVNPFAVAVIQVGELVAVALAREGVVVCFRGIAFGAGHACSLSVELDKGLRTSE